MNIASALIKQVLALQDFQTWSVTHRHYLPSEYHSLYKVIDKHCETFHKMPTVEDLKYEIRDSGTREKLFAIEAIEVDAAPEMLLQYLKNEYTQKEILDSLEDYVENSVAFEDAQESVNHLHQIVLDVEDKVDLEDPQESMQRIELFEPEEDIAKYMKLGLNEEYDYDIQFSPRDLVMVGGRRGAGKSVICANIANNVYASGKSAIYFTIEMDSRAILQRCCSIATEIPFSRLRSKNLSITEWEQVAGWWAARYVDGQDRLTEYKEHRDFAKLHTVLKNKCELLPTQQLIVEYDPSLTLSKIRAVLDKKVRQHDVGVIVVDYINQVKRSSLPSRGGQYDWTEQIEVSKALKSMAQEYDCTVFSPYQTDASGEARFAKGILDAADAAYSLETWDHEDACITLNCVKMRSASMKSFTSTVDWDTLKIGPESALTPKEKEDSSSKTGEEINDI
ncbi:MAG: DnaB helicase C-terminal domain-containing protein [Gammaproteobacteria bacterium]|nr:DnaB helicase C-terminal domain-containing protein [Gammaproteobacteria bacterium]